MEHVIWPEEVGEYKVIQLEVGSQYFLRFHREPILHADMLKFFLEENNIPYEMEEGINYPFQESEEYRLVGTGYAFIIPGEKEAIFYGRSKGYDIPINTQHLHSIGPFVDGCELRNIKSD